MGSIWTATFNFMWLIRACEGFAYSWAGVECR
jgi:hypothetical protein